MSVRLLLLQNGQVGHETGPVRICCSGQPRSDPDISTVKSFSSLPLSPWPQLSADSTQLALGEGVRDVRAEGAHADLLTPTDIQLP